MKAIHKKAERHGDTNSPLYAAWHGMTQRCRDKNNRSYKNYGGRGITVCEEWRTSYEAYKKWALANGYKHGLQIDRIDNNKGYSPDNCHFVTSKENGNNRRCTVRLTAFGETKSFSDWLDDPRCLVSRVTLETRLNRLKWPAEIAIASKPGTVYKSAHAVKPNSVLITAFGETKTVFQWSKDSRCVVKASGLYARIRKGVDPEKAITTPSGKSK